MGREASSSFVFLSAAVADVGLPGPVAFGTSVAVVDSFGTIFAASASSSSSPSPYTDSSSSSSRSSDGPTGSSSSPEKGSSTASTFRFIVCHWTIQRRRNTWTGPRPRDHVGCEIRSEIHSNPERVWNWGVAHTLPPGRSSNPCFFISLFKGKLRMGMLLLFFFLAAGASSSLPVFLFRSSRFQKKQKYSVNTLTFTDARTPPKQYNVRSAWVEAAWRFSAQ